WTTKALLAFVGSGLWAVAWTQGGAMGTVEAADRQRVQNVVTARILQIVDLKGNEKVAIDALDGGPRIRLYDEDHNIRASLSVSPDNSTLRFKDGDGNDRAIYGMAHLS